MHRRAPPLRGRLRKVPGKGGLWEGWLGEECERRERRKNTVAVAGGKRLRDWRPLTSYRVSIELGFVKIMGAVS